MKKKIICLRQEHQNQRDSLVWVPSFGLCLSLLLLAWVMTCCWVMDVRNEWEMRMEGAKFNQGWSQVLTKWWPLCKFLSLKLPCFHHVAPSPTWTVTSLCLCSKKTLESIGLQGDPTSPSQRKSVLNIHWKDWCWSRNCNTLATWCEELTQWKRPWCWERLKMGGEGDDRGWDGWMASPTRWTWVWVSSGSWWWTGRPGVLCVQSMGSQSVQHDWVTELNWMLHVGLTI